MQLRRSHKDNKQNSTAVLSVYTKHKILYFELCEAYMKHV